MSSASQGSVNSSGNPDPAGSPGVRDDELLTRTSLGGQSAATPQRPVIPDHELLHLIARGGFGEVWLARNVMGTYRAVKLVYRQHFEAEHSYEREFNGIKKFEPVSRSHDGLVDILHIGRNDDAGYYYYVMELSDDLNSGQEINPDHYEARTLARDLIRRKRLAFEECHRIGLSISSALSHLHKHGLIHRDIKPSNIIFVHGVPKIADIGLVTELASPQTFVGTIGFFPPEGPGSVQADLYALGKVLYVASSGRDRKAFPDFGTLPSDPGEQKRYAELCEVILKACSSDKHKRYRTADELHADLVLLQAGKSIRRLHALERRLALLLRAGIVAVALMAVGAVAYYQVSRDRRLARQYLAASHVTYGTRLMDDGDLLGALPSFVEALRLEQRDPGREVVHRVHIGAVLRQCPKLTHMWFQEGRINAARFSPDGQRLVIAGAKGQALVWDLPGNRLAFRLDGHRPDEDVESASYSLDGRLILTAGEDATARIWNAEDGREVLPDSPLKHPSTIYGAAFDANAKRIVTACKDGKVRVWTIASSEPPREFKVHSGPVRSASFSPDGHWIATASVDGTAKVLDADTGMQVGNTMQHGNWVYTARFSPDGRYVVTASYDKTAGVWDAASGALRVVLRPEAPVRSAEFSPDGRYIVAACWDYEFTTRVWDVSTSKETVPPLKHTGYVTSVFFSPEGHQVLSACANGTGYLWDLAGNKWVSSSSPIFYSPNGNTSVTPEPGLLHVRRFAPGSPSQVTLRPAGHVLDVKLNLDGSRLLSITRAARGDGQTAFFGQLWTTAASEPLGPPFPADDTITSAILSDKGDRVVTVTGAVVRVCEGVTGNPLTSFNHPEKVARAVLSPDASRLLSFGGSVAYFWNAATGEKLRSWPHPSVISHGEFSRNGRYAITCSGQGLMTRRFAQLWDGRTGEMLNRTFWHSDGLLHACFSPDGRRLVTASEDRSAAVWDTATGKMVGSPLIHKHQVLKARFSPDGRWVVTLDVDDTVQIWDAVNSLPITPRLTHPFGVWDVQFVDGASRIIAKSTTEGRWVDWSNPENPKPPVWRTWDVMPDLRPVEELALIAQVLSGHRRDQLSAGLPLAQHALKIAWKRLDDRYHSEFEVSKAETFAWHQREAATSEENGNWSAAVFHLNRLLAMHSEDEAIKQRLTNAVASLEQNKPQHD